MFGPLLTPVGLVRCRSELSPTTMDKDKAPEGGAFELLSWTTPAQFHFIVDRYNGFVEIARDDGEQAKFWKALEDDWSSVWDLTRYYAGAHGTS